MQKFDNDLGAGPDEYLALAGFLSIVDGIQRIVKDTCFDHFHEWKILNSMAGGEVSGTRGYAH